MRCFVIRGFGTKKDTAGQPIDFEKVHQELIAPALKACDLDGDTTVEVVGAGSIAQDMFELILKADIVICDITVHNPNVFYELGVRHALRKKHTVLIKGKESADSMPFDIAGMRYTNYSVLAPAQSLPAVIAAIEATRAADRVTDSPVFLMMPTLPAADVGSVPTVPLDFTEEVQLATVRKDRGWLRLLSEDVRGRIFEREGLKLVGRAQWKLKDFEVAAQTWEAVRLGDAQDLEANLALANVYERQFKSTGDAADIARSNQAIDRVLSRPDLAPAHLSEALALRGRNLKTLWRLAFQSLGTVQQRRERAIDTRARESYEAYRDASKTDLNNFFPGLAALQMGRIMASLAKEPRFRNLFGGDAKKAGRYVEDLNDELLPLGHVVEASINRALATEKDDNLLWARISSADLLFISHADEPDDADHSVVVDAYRDALQDATDSFYWNAARGQLELFEQLGIGATAARAVMDSLDAPAPPPGKRHVVIFSGYTVDKVRPKPPDVPRFPGNAQPKARELIKQALQQLNVEGEQLCVLASAAPGADILMLEVCKELGIDTWLCLPLRRDVVASEVFAQYDDDWRNRFFALADAHAKPPAPKSPARTFVMSDTVDLPGWLFGSGTTPWSRGNRWMLHQARAWGADRMTLLALWNDDAEDASTGGTAEIVRLARKAGSFPILTINSRQLTAD